jgi:hypothetical protein
LYQSRNNKGKKAVYKFFLCEGRKKRKNKLAVLINDVCSDCGNEIIIKKEKNKFSYCFWQVFFSFLSNNEQQKGKKRSVTRLSYYYIFRKGNESLLQSSIKKLSTKI